MWLPEFGVEQKKRKSNAVPLKRCFSPMKGTLIRVTKREQKPGSPNSAWYKGRAGAPENTRHARLARKGRFI